MKLPPLAVAACALIAGITAAAAAAPPVWLPAAFFIGGLLAACLIELSGRSAWRAAAVFLVFLSLGALLMAFSGTAVKTVSSAPETHADPRYKTIASEAVRALGKRQGGLMLAIVFGDQDAVDGSMRDDFLRAGLLHLFAASGFNLTLAAGFIMLVARALKLPKLSAATLALASIGFYFMLVGPSPSVLRATVMSIVLYLAIFFGRRIDALASTSTAVLVLLAIDPTGLFNIGWQLSFAGLLGILLLAPKMNDYLKPETARLAEPVVVTTGAQVAVAPLLLYHFGQVSTVALLANPVVTLAIALVTGVGFTGGLIALFWSAGGRAIFALLAWPLVFIEKSASLFAAMPAATLQVRPSFLSAAAFIVAIIVAAGFAVKRQIRLGPASIIIIFMALQATGIWLDLAAGIQRPALTAAFLDVGEGDATLIKSRKGAIILIDGGRDYEDLDRELRRRGVKHIDLLILSHAHADHLGSLDELMDKYPVAMVLEPGFPYTTQSYREFKRAIADHRIPFDLARAGRKLRVDDVRIDILWPKAPLMAGTESDINNNSVVAKVSYKDFELLLPGDIQNEAIAELLRVRANLKAHVIKVSHQGSVNGTTKRLLATVKPAYAVISVGKGNPYGHPHRSTLSRLNAFARRIARTDQDGNVTISTDGHAFDLTTDR